MVRRHAIAVLAAAVLVLPPAAAAAAEPAAYASARSGTLNVVSGVLVLRNSADLRGVWLDDTRSCFEQRRLNVRVEVFFTPASGPARRAERSKSGRVGNCAEGGPNFGFRLFASRLGYACPNGSWKPGSYSFVTRTRDTVSGLVSTASLNWEKPGSC